MPSRDSLSASWTVHQPGHPAAPSAEAAHILHEGGPGRRPQPDDRTQAESRDLPGAANSSAGAVFGAPPCGPASGRLLALTPGCTRLRERQCLCCSWCLGVCEADTLHRLNRLLKHGDVRGARRTMARVSQTSLFGYWLTLGFITRNCFSRELALSSAPTLVDDLVQWDVEAHPQLDCSRGPGPAAGDAGGGLAPEGLSSQDRDGRP